jgi:hypothetical protein
MSCHMHLAPLVRDALAIPKTHSSEKSGKKIPAQINSDPTRPGPKHQIGLKNPFHHGQGKLHSQQKRNLFILFWTKSCGERCFPLRPGCCDLFSDRLQY